MIYNIIGWILISLTVPLIFGIKTATDDKYEDFRVGFFGVLFMELIIALPIIGLLLILK